MTLRLVREVGHCLFCLRALPREDLVDAPGGHVCLDPTACIEEVSRQEASGWKDHPALRQTA
jgi:hypothetical protein